MKAFERLEIRRIVSQVSLGNNADTLKTNDDLFALGILDSIAIVQLVTLLESKFGFRFDFADLAVLNFKTLNAIESLLSQKYRIQFE